MHDHNKDANNGNVNNDNANSKTNRVIQEVILKHLNFEKQLLLVVNYCK